MRSCFATGRRQQLQFRQEAQVSMGPCVILVGSAGSGMLADDLHSAGMRLGQRMGEGDATPRDLGADRVSNLERFG